MTPEDRLRDAIRSRTSRVEPSADALQHIEEKLMEAQQHDNRNRVFLGIGSAAVIIAVIVGVLALTGDDDPVSSDGTTTTSETTTTEDTTTTEGTTTTTTFAGIDPALPVFPDPTTSQRFDDPKAAATAFVSDFLGFSTPIVGDFAQGDSRSGEVEVRPFDQGLPTGPPPPARGRLVVRDRGHDRRRSSSTHRPPATPSPRRSRSEARRTRSRGPST